MSLEAETRPRCDVLPWLDWRRMCIEQVFVPLVWRLAVWGLLSTVLTLTACGGSATTSVTSPTATATRCQPSFDATPRSFAAGGGRGSIAVTVARECPWSASTATGWVAIVAGAQGQGDGAVTFEIAGNPDPILRQGTLAIGRRTSRTHPAGGRVPFRREPATRNGHRRRRWAAGSSPHPQRVRLVGRIRSVLGDGCAFSRAWQRRPEPDGYSEYRR